MYETPEIFEVGAAERLTLGGGPSPYDDNCGCEKKEEVIIIVTEV